MHFIGPLCAETFAAGTEKHTTAANAATPQVMIHVEDKSDFVLIAPS